MMTGVLKMLGIDDAAVEQGKQVASQLVATINKISAQNDEILILLKGDKNVDGRTEDGNQS